ILKSSELNGRFGPDVAHFEDERDSLDAAQQVGCNGAKELRRSAYNDVRPACFECSEENRRSEEGEKVEYSSSESLVGRNVNPSPKDFDAFDALLSEYRAAIFGTNDTCWVVRETGNHGDIVANARPMPGVLEGASGWRPHLGRKILAEK